MYISVNHLKEVLKSLPDYDTYPNNTVQVMFIPEIEYLIQARDSKPSKEFLNHGTITFWKSPALREWVMHIPK